VSTNPPVTTGGPVPPSLTWHDDPDLPEVFHPGGGVCLPPSSDVPTPIPLGGPTAAEPTADDAPRGKVYGGQQINVGDEVFWVWQIITMQQLRFGRYGHWLPLSVGCLPGRVIPET
jgi:hypothetical protein